MRGMSENGIKRDRFRWSVTLLAVVIATSGCAPRVTRFAKPGGTHQEYMQTRHRCLKENMQEYYGAGVYANNSFGGVNLTATTCLNGGMFDTCMAMEGWQIDSKGFAPPGRGVRRCPGS